MCYIVILAPWKTKEITDVLATENIMVLEFLELLIVNRHTKSL